MYAVLCPVSWFLSSEYGTVSAPLSPSMDIISDVLSAALQRIAVQRSAMQYSTVLRSVVH